MPEDGGNTWTSIFDEDQYMNDVTAGLYHLSRIRSKTLSGKFAGAGISKNHIKRNFGR
jgi:hypothetical protein